MTAPFFSVVIPTYNRAARIVEAVSSVVGQDEGDLEVVVVDDGSTDGTVASLESRFSNESRVRCVAQPHSERGAARNRGLRESKGEFVVFLDSDDRMAPGHLATLRRAIRDHPESNFFTTRYELERDGQRRVGDSHMIEPGHHGIEIVLEGNPLACNACVRKSNPGLILFRETPRYESEDWVFWIQNLRHDVVWVCGESTIVMCDHPGRTMRGISDDLIRAKESATEWILSNTDLDARQRRTLEAGSFLYCAVHAFGAGRRLVALRYLGKALSRGAPLSRCVGVLARVLAGRRLVELLKRFRRTGDHGPS